MVIMQQIYIGVNSKTEEAYKLICHTTLLIAIIEDMKVSSIQNKTIDISKARFIQKELAFLISREGGEIEPSYVAGVDIATRRTNKISQAAVVILSYPEMDLVEIELAKRKIDFPYIPGLLSFRELPLILAAIRKLEILPDLIMVDGHGIAHPRRFGIASHLGLLLDKATIGCAKTRLCGSHAMPGEQSGNYTTLIDKDESIGAVLRTKNGVKPVFISIGHKISLENSIHWVKQCCFGYRLPEPTRLAHLAAGGKL